MSSSIKLIEARFVMLCNSKLSRQYSKLKHNISDIYHIIRELDRKTGLKARQCDIIINKYLDSLGRFNFFYSRINLKESTQEIRSYFEERIDSVKTIKLASSIDEWTFTFKEEVLEWDYEMLKELVIHEYAHYVETTKLQWLDINYKTHGEVFAEIVRSLGGKFISPNVAQDTTIQEKNNILQWKSSYKRKIKPNLITLCLCYDDCVIETLYLGLPYNNEKYRNFKKLFNQYSLAEEVLSEETLISSTDVEFFISSEEFYSNYELYSTYYTNSRYWL